MATERELLALLGRSQSLESFYAESGMTSDEFQTWWQAACKSRVPDMDADLSAHVGKTVSIERDSHGVPHIYAETQSDLFFGYGFAMAQDRLFQLDYLRRKGSGRLAEVLGSDGIALDTIARTVGLNRIAQAEWKRLPEHTQSVLKSFSAGINAFIEQAGDCLPIEFDLLDYRPEPWSPVDSLAIEVEFRWYLTGRFPVVVIPELTKRVLGEGDLWNEFLLGEADAEAIMPAGSYVSETNSLEPVGQVLGGPDDGTGSNNWVVSGSRSASGKPMVASDPHIAIEAVSCWYEAHLQAGEFNVAGMGYVGMPVLMFGRNEKVAWSITNNICSQRDLYQEQTSDDHSGCFLYDGNWEPATELTESIVVKGQETIQKTVRYSRNGPIVDEILPPPSDKTGPVSLKWLGSYEGGWLTALLAMNVANNVEELTEAMRPWHVPTFGLCLADTDGHIGFKAAGRIPVRKQEERGYRPGWDPEHQWQGLIPFDDMPGVIDPEQAWMASANNRLVAEDFPYPLFGRWNSGYRMQRIREMIESQESCSFSDFRDMQQDPLSVRAVDRIPQLLAVLKQSDNAQIQEACSILGSWDGNSLPELVGPTLFNVFVIHWTKLVTKQRFDSAELELVSTAAEALAMRLLNKDVTGWFEGTNREEKITEAFQTTLDDLTQRLGSDISKWTWGRLHVLPLKHVLSERGELGTLLNAGGQAVRGDFTTVCNTGRGPDWEALSGGGYRMIADMSSDPPAIQQVDVQSQSGHPGSDHYRDQFEQWNSGQYHELSLCRKTAAQSTKTTFQLNPQS